MSRRLLFGYLAVTVLVLAVLEIPLAVTQARGARSELIDKVELPAGRTLIGFGPGGIVYLLARDAGATRIEQARFK